MAQVTLSQATIAYRVLGPENSPHRPVLFVHGILVDDRLWSAVAEGLAAMGFRCILPTWPLVPTRSRLTKALTSPPPGSRR